MFPDLLVAEAAGQTGSFLNMAPEVVLGRDYNEKADIFSLGVVMYEIFSKVITAAIVMTSSDPYECQDYAFKVGLCHVHSQSKQATDTVLSAQVSIILLAGPADSHGKNCQSALEAPRFSSIIPVLSGTRKAWSRLP